MAATLETIQSEIKKNGKELVAIKKRIGSLEKDMKKVLKCVSTENADFKIKRSRSSSVHSSGMAMAAKSK